ncbi:hypothetical protein HF086_003107 [Spodoptera exigua]|uniref:PKD/REJ-like domain-containing protein n=1 Tax=Spodoptera exigua TaxID=7107 RepID=A0A922M3G5_SPOEX|nr:hypothetical protein HF086_003107 [Spodoptera exigua]
MPVAIITRAVHCTSAGVKAGSVKGCSSKSNMILINAVVIYASALFIGNVVGEAPNFRILAPAFVCPKDKDAVIDKPDTTIITLQTDSDIPVEYIWTVRWETLEAPSQQFTLALWRNVRELESQLNDLPMEPNVFVINNTELLSGVTYIFNVTATTYRDKVGTQKEFRINNVKGDSKLLMEGRSEMFSIILLGGQLAYADIDFMLEAKVTACYKTHDYYESCCKDLDKQTKQALKHNVIQTKFYTKSIFETFGNSSVRPDDGSKLASYYAAFENWSKTKLTLYFAVCMSSEGSVAVSDVKGSRLVIRANTLTPGAYYDVVCQVYKYSTGDFITQSSLPFRVLHRNVTINFNVDLMSISAERPLKLSTDINKLDYIGEGMTIAWECTTGGEPVETFYQTDDDGHLYFPSGLLYAGEYLMKVTVDVRRHSISEKAITRVIAVDPLLPVIQLQHMPRVVNEGTVVTIHANVSNVHGTEISTPINFYSLEQNFLSELTDYTNETSWRSVSANFEAAAGRVRVVAQCNCKKDENCTGEGEVFAGVVFELNERPDTGYVLVTPEMGTAMETVFRLSTHRVPDVNKPLKYTFYCDLNNNDTLLLGTYLEHNAVETLLPYIEGGINVWVEVCDSLGACTPGSTTLVPVAPGEARTIDALIEDVRAHVRRCELTLLRRLAATAVVSYTNAAQTEAFSKFTTSLLNALGGIEERCIERNYDLYNDFMYWLQKAGVDTTKLM